MKNSTSIQSTPQADFVAAIERAGLTPPSVLAPGKMTRFPGIGKTNKKLSGWAFLFEDRLGGAYGDWARDLSVIWQAKRTKKMTKAEQAAQRRQLAELHLARVEEERLRHEEAAKRARSILAGATPAPALHPYLIKKGIQPHGLRVDKEGQLIVPVMVNGILTSLQFIDANGTKKFLLGGAIKGGSATIGAVTAASSTILIGEGFATCASLHEDTGFPAVVAFSAGNLTVVATQLRQQFPEARIVICGDNDASCTGQAEAHKAARAVNGVVALPEVEGADFNDLHRNQGLDAVKGAIAAATSDMQKAQLNSPVH